MTRNRRLGMWLAAWLGTMAIGLQAAELKLTENGEPRASIVIAAKPTAAAQFAAHELQYHLQLITGATLPIVDDAAEVTGARLLVGESAATHALGVPTTPLQPQEWLISPQENAVVLMGLDAPKYDPIKYGEDDPFAFRTWPDYYEPHATCDAVYEFLEQLCDVRWLRPGTLGMVYPHRPTLSVTPADVRQAPAFAYRDPMALPQGNSEGWEARTGLWNRIKDPAQVDRIEDLAYPDLVARWGRPSWNYTHAKRQAVRLFLYRLRAGGEAYSCNHSFYGYYDRFLKEHPDWFAKGYEGQPPQMCYTNREFTAQVVADADAYFATGEKDKRAVAAGDYFALVPMDNSRYCHCDACRALERPDAPGAGMFSNGRWSDLVFDFANRVANEVAKKHPDKILSTLAYASYAYPPDFEVAPNISVGFCLHARNCWNTAMQENDLALLKAWHDRYPDRRYFLFVYYCFPVENAGSSWYCFPGFFARTIGKEMTLYHENNVRGAFFCGFGQDVESYVALKLMVDPEQDANRLVEDYFKRMYGPAWGPLRQFYDRVESIYSTPSNYPRDYRAHQTEQVAWENLGTPVRMAVLAGLMAEARRLAADADPDIQQRVRLFDEAVWQYMLTGYRRYNARQWVRLQPFGKPLRLATTGDPETLARSVELPLAWQPYGLPSNSRATVSFGYADNRLIVRLSDPDPAADGGDWELLFQLRRQSPGHRFRITPEGEISAADSITGKPVETTAARIDQPGDLTVAIPFAELVPEGFEPGWSVLVQAARHLGGDRWVMNRPNAIHHEDTSLLQDLPVDPIAAVTPAESWDVGKGVGEPESLGEGITVTTHDVLQLAFSTNDLLQGKPLTVEPPRAWWTYRDVYKPKECLALTDANSARTPTDFTMPQFAPAISFSWDVGDQPAGGLKRLRLWWSVGDAARTGLKMQFSVRTLDGKWVPVTGEIEVKPERFPDQTFRALTVDLKPDAIPAYNAVRMTDLLGKYNPRYLELDAFTAPPKGN